MSVLTVRGGVPRVWRGSVTALRERGLPHYTNYIKVRVLSVPVKMYFTIEDATADDNYVLIPIPAAETPYGEWEGPVEADKLWFKSTAGAATVELVTFQRRG